MRLIRDEHKRVRAVYFTDADKVALRWTSPSGMYWLPSHPEFNRVKDAMVPESIKATLNTGNYSRVLIQRPGIGVNELVTPKQLDEYLHSGEYDAREAELN